MNHFVYFSIKRQIQGLLPNLFSCKVIIYIKLFKNNVIGNINIILTLIYKNNMQ